jgi:hypothetical protein
MWVFVCAPRLRADIRVGRYMLMHSFCEGLCARLHTHICMRVPLRYYRMSSLRSLSENNKNIRFESVEELEIPLESTDGCVAGVMKAFNVHGAVTVTHRCEICYTPLNIFQPHKPAHTQACPQIYTRVPANVHKHAHKHKHIHTHAHAHAHAHTHTHTRTHARKLVHTRAHKHARTRTHTKTHTQKRTRKHTHAHTRTPTHTHIHTHAHTRAHARTHAHTWYDVVPPQAHLTVSYWSGALAQWTI